MGIAFSLIALFLFIRHNKNAAIILAIGAEFFACGLLVPWILKPAYIIWMGLSFVLGWINARLILSVMFYLVLAPIALVMKLFKKDLLGERIEKGGGSYWIKKEKKDFNRADYERQF